MSNTDFGGDNVVCFADAGSSGGLASPAAMALHLRKTNPFQALSFAVAMHESAVWANEGWGHFWADVIRLV